MNLRNCLTVVAVMSVVTSLAFCAPVIDGTVNVGEYSFSADDLTGESGVSPGLDIQTVSFERTGGWLYVGLQTLGPIDTNGEGTLGQMQFVQQLSDALIPQYMIEIRTTGPLQQVLLADYAAGTFAFLTPGVDYQLAFGNSMEMAISMSKLASLQPEFAAYSLLDGMGTAPDDEFTANVPEPATMALLALGVPALLARRKTRA